MSEIVWIGARLLIGTAVFFLLPFIPEIMERSLPYVGIAWWLNQAMEVAAILIIAWVVGGWIIRPARKIARTGVEWLRRSARDFLQRA